MSDNGAELGQPPQLKLGVPSLPSFSGQLENRGLSDQDVEHLYRAHTLLYNKQLLFQESSTIIPLFPNDSTVDG